MPYDPLTHRRIVVVDVLDVSTGLHQGEAVEVLIPRRETPTWRGHPTAAQVLAWLAKEPEVKAAGKDTAIVNKSRPGLDALQRLLAVVKELKRDAALSAWRTKRSLRDAEDPTDRTQAAALDAERKAGDGLLRADEP